MGFRGRYWFSWLSLKGKTVCMEDNCGENNLARRWWCNRACRNPATMPPVFFSQKKLQPTPIENASVQVFP